jgi:hypothetical protein
MVLHDIYGNIRIHLLLTQGIFIKHHNDRMISSNLHHPSLADPSGDLTPLWLRADVFFLLATFLVSAQPWGPSWEIYTATVQHSRWLQFVY